MAEIQNINGYMICDRQARDSIARVKAAADDAIINVNKVRSELSTTQQNLNQQLEGLVNALNEFRDNINNDFSATLEDLASRKGFLDDKDVGLIADGETDNTDAFNYAIDFCVNNGIKLFLPPGVYKATDIFNSNTFGSKEDKTLIIEGSGQGTIIVADSLKFKGRIHPVISNLQFKFYKEGLVFGDETTYANRGAFTNVIFYGSPVCVNFAYANAIDFHSCRFGSIPDYAKNPDAKPVVLFSNEGTQAVNNIMFFRCQFEQTMSNGYFLVKSTTDLANNIAFFGCHFETRNYASSFFHLNTVDDLAFYSCAFIGNANTDVAIDENEQIPSYMEGCFNVTFDNCLFDYKRQDNAALMNVKATNKFRIDGRITNLKDLENPTIYDVIPTIYGCSKDTWKVNLYISSDKSITSVV